MFSEELSQSQVNFGSANAFDSYKKDKQQNERRDDHDCRKSGSCKTEWRLLGCAHLYRLATVKERREFFRIRQACYQCGYKRTNETDNQDKSGFWTCKPDVSALSSPTKCKDQQCKLGAALCFTHAPNNAKQELLDWIKKNQIKITVTTMFSSPVSSTCQHSTDILPSSKIKFSKAERSKLQTGDLCVPFPDKQLTDFFVNDLQGKGFKANKYNVLPVPEGDVAFVFCKIKGKKSSIQAFIDSGANCAIMADGIPQREMDSCKLQDGPISIDVATGVVVHATGEWGSVLPLSDGSLQVIRGLTVPRVTSDMPRMRLESWFEKVRSVETENSKLQDISIPKELGGHVDMIIGISFNLVHPEVIHTFPDGLTVYKSKFLPANPGELACIGGPMASINNMVQNAGARSTIRHLSNFLSNMSAGYSPRMEFFPSSTPEMERTFDVFVDKGIPSLSDFLLAENNLTDDDESLLEGLVVDDVEPAVACDDCGEKVLYNNQSNTVQAELKRFLQQQEVGLNCSFRCMRCRDCKLCVKGAGEERKSMMQEAHQEIIRQSVHIDKTLGRAVAKLPFLTDPAGKLTNNRRLATKRLAKGDPDLVRLLDMMLVWRVVRVLSQVTFGNSITMFCLLLNTGNTNKFS